MARNYQLPADDAGRADFFALLTARLPNHGDLLDIDAADLASVQDGAATATIPAAVVLPTPAPTAVSPGIVGRFTGLAARIKNHRNYSEAIGQELAIVGAGQIDDPSSWKPLRGVGFQAGQPIVRGKRRQRAGNLQ